MAISIDWANKIINVPKADMTLIQTNPTEIRELDIDAFRLELKALEASVEGMPFEDTHTNVAPITVGGVQLARVIEIINGYTITFEDGQYAVNLQGANSNIGDRVNVNQVSVRSSNSAGLVQTSEIQYASYQNAVTIDTVNGTAGQAYPIGTVESPVNNLTDAVFIANLRGFDTIRVVGSYTLDSSDVVDNFIFEGRSPTKTSMTLTSAATVTNCVFRRMTVNGDLDGGNDISNCIVIDLNYIDGALLDCFLFGTITLSGSQANFLRCASGVAGGGPSQTPTIDSNGGGTDITVRDYHGGLRFINNSTAGDNISIDMSSGRVIVESSVSASNYYIRGIAQVTDNSTGTAVVDVSGLLDATEIRADLSIVRKINTNRIHTDPNTGVLTVFDDDDVTVFLQGNIYEDVLAAQIYRGQGIERRNKLT